MAPPVEIFIELGIAWLIIIFRIFARTRQLGIGKVQIDDYLMVFAGCLYAGEVTCAYCVEYYKEINLADIEKGKPGASVHKSPEWIDRADASKIFLAGWLTYTSLLWTLKTCILLFYARLTYNVHINNMKLRIRIGGAALVVTYITLVCVILFVCSPIQKKWQAGPIPGSECHGSTANTNTYSMLVFNILTDMYLIYLPIPVIWAANLGRKQKIGLTALFAGAVITAIFGFLRCIIIITAPGMEGASLAGVWSVRESFTAVIVTNIPLIYPYVNQLRHTLKSGTTSKGTSQGNSHTFGGYGNGSAVRDVAHASDDSKSSRKKKRSPYATPGDTILGASESEEHIVQDPANKTMSADIELSMITWQSVDKQQADRRRSVDNMMKF